MRCSAACRLTTLLVAVIAGCAINPVSGRPEVALISAAKEKEIGERKAKDVEQSMGLVPASALVTYVESVGHRLAEASPRRDVEYRFFVADVAVPNAFALPGGYVYVTRGLLALVNSEDELAGVIGHEIGHVAARHSVRQISRAAPFGLVTGITAGVASLASPLLGKVVGGIGGLASDVILSPFDRDQEREADRIGQQLAAACGWDPAATSTFLSTLENEEKLRDHRSQRFDFFATHPSTPERVANTATYARELTRARRDPLTASRDDFLVRLDGLVIGRRAADGVFDGQTFLHPDLDFTLTFPRTWQTQNTRRAVAAVAPDGAALIILNGGDEGGDPLDGARAFEKAIGSPVVDKTKRVAIGDLEAARTRLLAHSNHGDLSVEIAWIAHAGHISQIAGMTPLARAEGFTPVFDAVLESFRPLRPTERAGIREEHLRIVEARRGEMLTALVSRVHGSWSVDETAVANALSRNDTLTMQQHVKVAIAEPYSK